MTNPSPSPPSDAAALSSDKRFRMLADLMPQIVWTADVDGHVNYVNKRWEAFSVAGANGEGASKFEDSLHPDDKAAWLACWKTALADNTVFEMEARLRCVSDGSWRRHLHHAVPIRSPGGPTLQWFGTSADTEDGSCPQTTQILLEERATGALALSNHLLDAMRDRSEAIVKLERQTLHLNEVITTQSHLAQAELELEGFMVIVVERILMLTPATGAVVELAEGEQMVYRAASGSVRPYIGLRIKKEGSLSGRCVITGQMLDCPDTSTDLRVDYAACQKVGAASMVVTPLVDRGRVVGVLKILSNQANAFSPADLQTLQLMAGLIGAAISHQQQFELNQQLLAERTQALTTLAQEVERRRLSEETLRASEARTRLIIESSGEAFVAINNDGVVTDWNRQAALVFGWSCQDMLGRRLEDMLIPKHQRDAFMQALELASGNQATVQRLELIACTGDRGEIPIEMTLSGVRTGEYFLYSAFLRDISERRRHEAMLLHLAEHDVLTGLPNRRAFETKLQVHCAENVSTKQSALLFLDLDGFKAVNDRYGHEAGDLLLKEVASRLSACVRDSDTLARLGGDEFVILLSGLVDGDHDAQRIAQAIVKRLGEPVDLGGSIVNIGTSIGIAMREGSAKTDGATLLQRADAAMYDAKCAGKNRFHVWVQHDN
ncbi:diguanylate cyclase domain-containing protein [Chitinimonas sp. PSY-7]|uniref:diguanylate cyclase domain-containing protein n=1 Tax=Chitinimonas sp. PSY-7 TaxID=3459088 RepID=UPI004040135B